MSEQQWLAEQFETNRPHLWAVAYRMLASASEAEDAVQEAWLRLTRSDASGVENLSAWLTTIVARISLDILRSRKARREEPLDLHGPELERMESRKDGSDPEHEALLADSVGLALLVVLDRLSPPERLAFVLHDMFAVPFDVIASIIGRTPTAARQLASRARRRVQGKPLVPDADLTRRRSVAQAFLSASRAGNFDALLVVLDPDVVLRADALAAPASASEIRGASNVAGRAVFFSQRGQFARLALVNGDVGIVVVPRGQLLLVQVLTIVGEKITQIEVITDPVSLRQINLAVLSN